MTWPLAIFGCFAVLVFSIVGFLLFVYVKEYNRDEKTLKEFMKFKEQMTAPSPMVYVLEQPAKKKAPPPPPKLTDKNKKDIN